MPVSKTQKIIDDYTEKIESGELRPGDKLPSASQLRLEYGVSITVVRYAVGWLKAANLAVGVPGVGVFVADEPGNEPPAKKSTGTSRRPTKAADRKKTR